ncbi:hypothetical protein L1987_04837 [Smallanthus sonchifolius]|uniref:Uncharacterized protein n=1 Tax=Smallanthus sonchifolius TaxID=185202 RepID=A0ACB9JTR6_9ASTR|nr:hypothetical protein L1987_04837 [Smallanthus sonchifolius]
MTDDHHRQNQPTNPQQNPRVRGEIGGTNHFKPNYPNPPDISNPDAATLREQWKYAIRQYSKWYSHAWGTAILAGVSFFALGWVIKGGNPIHSFHQNDDASPDSPDADQTR